MGVNCAGISPEYTLLAELYSASVLVPGFIEVIGDVAVSLSDAVSGIPPVVTLTIPIGLRYIYSTHGKPYITVSLVNVRLLVCRTCLHFWIYQDIEANDLQVKIRLNNLPNPT